MFVRRSWVLPLGLAMAATGFFPPPAPCQERLTLDMAQRLALDDQPLLEAQAAVVEAQRARAVAAGQLPDPELQLALSDLPVNGEAAGSLRRDAETDVMIGVMQEYPRAAKRRLRQLREQAGARQSEETLRDLTGLIRRDAGLTYLDAYYNQRAMRIVEAQLAQTTLQEEALRIRFAAGSAPQSELLAASVESAALRDKVAQYRQMLAHERLRLARWIGPAAQGDLTADLPVLPAPPPLERLLEGLARHPSLVARERASELARYSLDLARQEYKPDWRVELGYGYRPEFPEMLTLRVAIGLPYFTRNRQDQQAAAARHELQAATSHRANRQRELAAEASLAHHDWRLYRERLEDYQQAALPLARARVEAAQAAYGAGSGTFAQVLAARRALLDVELQLLTLSVEATRNRIALEYFLEPGVQP